MTRHLKRCIMANPGFGPQPPQLEAQDEDVDTVDNALVL
jgi:hypothetical protein